MFFFFSFRNAGAIVKESAEQKAAPTTNAAAIENEEKKRVQRSDIRKITYIDMYVQLVG